MLNIEQLTNEELYDLLKQISNTDEIEFKVVVQNKELQIKFLFENTYDYRFEYTSHTYFNYNNVEYVITQVSTEHNSTIKIERN